MATTCKGLILARSLALLLSAASLAGCGTFNFDSKGLTELLKPASGMQAGGSGSASIYSTRPAVKARRVPEGNPGGFWVGKIDGTRSQFTMQVTLVPGSRSGYSHVSYPDLFCSSLLEQSGYPRNGKLSFSETTYVDPSKTCSNAAGITFNRLRNGAVGVKLFFADATLSGQLKPAVVPIPNALVGAWKGQVTTARGFPSSIRVTLSQDDASYAEIESSGCTTRLAFQSSYSEGMNLIDLPNECDGASVVSYQRVSRDYMKRTAYDLQGRPYSETTLTRDD